MINTVKINTAASGPVVLTFSNWAIRRFCQLTGCNSNKSAILVHLLFGEDRIETTVAMLQSGAEGTAKQKGTAFKYSDFEISEWVDETQSDDDANRIVYAFLGSLWGKSPDEVPALIEELTVKAKEKLEDPGHDDPPNQ